VWRLIGFLKVYRELLPVSRAPSKGGGVKVVGLNPAICLRAKMPAKNQKPKDEKPQKQRFIETALWR